MYIVGIVLTSLRYAGVKQIAELIKQSGLGRLMSPSAFDAGTAGRVCRDLPPLMSSFRYLKYGCVSKSASVTVARLFFTFAELHFFDGGPLTVQYLLAVDALNFCFWPDDELQYEHLAQGLKARSVETANASEAHHPSMLSGTERSLAVCTATCTQLWALLLRLLDQAVAKSEEGPQVHQCLLLINCKPASNNEHLELVSLCDLQSNCIIPLQAAVIADPEALSAARLAQATGDDVQSLLGWPRPVPLQAERARLLREVG